jgi:hypothetical protein
MCQTFRFDVDAPRRATWRRQRVQGKINDQTRVTLPISGLLERHGAKAKDSGDTIKEISPALGFSAIFFPMRRNASEEREKQLIQLFRGAFLKGMKTQSRTLLSEEKAFTSSSDLEHWMNLAEKISQLRKTSRLK